MPLALRMALIQKKMALMALKMALMALKMALEMALMKCYTQIKISQIIFKNY